MTTPNNNPNIDGTIRIIVEYDDAQSAQFAENTDSPDFPATQNDRNSQSGRFDIAGVLNKYSQEQSSYSKEIVSVLSTIAVSMGLLTQTMQNLNANTIKAMSVEAIKDTKIMADEERKTNKILAEEERRDAKFRADNSRKNRELNREQTRKDDINVPKIEAEQNRAEKALGDALKSLQTVETEEARTKKESNAAELIASKIVEALEMTERKSRESQEKIDRDNRLASAQTRRNNTTSRNAQTRLDERQVEALLKMSEMTRKEVAVADKESARAVTAQEYSVDAGQRREEREFNYQRRFTNRDVYALSDERRREYEQERQRKRDVVSTYGEEEGGRILRFEERDKLRQRAEYDKQYNKEQGIGGYQEKTMKQMHDTLVSILGVFTFGAAFKNSKVANELLGTIGRIMGVMMDVFLTPFLPLLVPLIHAMAKLIPMIQGFIQSFMDNPSEAIWNLIKDIFSPSAWKSLISNLFPEMSAGDVLKVIFGGGAALLLAGGLLSAPLILTKLFGAGTGLLGRGIMSLLGRGGGSTTTGSNVMFGRSVGGFTGAVGAFSRAVGAFSLGRGGMAGSRFATPMIGPQMPAATRYAGSRFATPMIGPQMPATAASSGISRVIPVSPMPVTSRIVPASLGTVGVAGGYAGSRFATPMIGPQMPNSSVVSPAGNVTSAMTRSSRQMARSSSVISSSLLRITRMSSIVGGILPAVASLTSLLGPIALIAGVVGLGMLGYAMYNRIQNRKEERDSRVNDPLQPTTDFVLGKETDAPVGSDEYYSLDYAQVQMNPWDTLSEKEGTRVNKENFPEYYGEDWSNMDMMARIYAGYGVPGLGTSQTPAEGGAMTGSSEMFKGDLTMESLNKSFAEYKNPIEWLSLAPEALKAFELAGAKDFDRSSLYGGTFMPARYDEETGNPLNVSQQNWSQYGDVTSQEESLRKLVLIEMWLEKLFEKETGNKIDVRFDATEKSLSVLSEASSGNSSGQNRQFWEFDYQTKTGK